MTYSERDERLRLQDLALKAKVGHWATLDLMRPSDYCRPRDLVPMPWREAAKPSGLVHRTTVCAGSPKTPEQAAYRSDYALRLELGDRAYAVLTGRKVKRTRANGRKAVERPKPVIREVSSGLSILHYGSANELGLETLGQYHQS